MKGFLIGVMMLFGFAPWAHAEERSLKQPLRLDFGVPCQAVKDMYETEVADVRGTVETLRLVRPESVFAGASRIVVSCNAGNYAALIVMGEPSEKGPGAIEVLNELEGIFGKPGECPPIKDEPVTCGIYQSESTGVIFTAARDEPGEYSLLYAPVPEGKGVEQ